MLEFNQGHENARVNIIQHLANLVALLIRDPLVDRVHNNLYEVMLALLVKHVMEQVIGLRRVRDDFVDEKHVYHVGLLEGAHVYVLRVEIRVEIYVLEVNLNQRLEKVLFSLRKCVDDFYQLGNKFLLFFQPLIGVFLVKH